MRRVTGQASVEYVAVVAVVGLVLAGAVALTEGGLARWIVWGWETGLCHVTGAPCPARPGDVADLPPCPLDDTEHTEGGSIQVAVLHLGRKLGLRTVRFSDGHVEVSFTDAGTDGLSAGLGARLKLGPVSVGATADAGVAWGVTAGKTWSFPDAAAARAFVARFGGRQTLGGRALHLAGEACLPCRWFGHGPAPLPPPAHTTYEHGEAVELLGDVAAGWGLRGAGELGRHMLGLRRDRDGGGALYLETGDTGRLSSPLLAGASAELGGASVIELDYDRAGHPTTIVAHRARRRAAGVAGPGGLLGATAAEGTMDETQSRLPYPSPADMRGALALVGGRFDSAAASADVVALVSDLRRRAIVDVRRYALHVTRGEMEGGAEADGLGGEAGLEIGDTHLRLLGQTTRVPGLPALPRDDCARPLA